MSCLDCGSLLMVGTDRVCNVCRDINALTGRRRQERPAMTDLPCQRCGEPSGVHVIPSMACRVQAVCAPCSDTVEIEPNTNSDESKP